MALDSEGDLFIVDAWDQRIRRVRADGIIDTVAGWGQVFLYGEYFPVGQGGPPAIVDGAPAFLMPLTSPQGLAVDSRGNLYIGETGNGRLRKGTILRTSGFGPPQLIPQPVVNAANLLPSPVAPGELVTLFGTNLGPPGAIGARLDALGRFSTNLAGVRVLFDGVPAPVLYAQAYQVNAIVPFAVTPGSAVRVQVEYNGTQSTATTIEVTKAAPAIFSLDHPSPRGGRAAALNQDGSINSPENPAPVGSIVTLYATGAGSMQPAIPDGQVVTAVNVKPSLPVIVNFNHNFPDCFTNPNAVPVTLGLGQPDPGTYVFSKYFSRVPATVAVR
ncbi:MAG: hypothetical protein DMG57_12595 [Acidobacteria bacterium]|nr:MAG: hypothetical protein DMG57_12595 [Acidobacteriota bacterium]